MSKYPPISIYAGEGKFKTCDVESLSNEQLLDEYGAECESSSRRISSDPRSCEDDLRTELESRLTELTELRAKLTEQEAKYTTLLDQRYEDMTEFRFRGKTAAELTKILARAEAAEAEAAALRERERCNSCDKLATDHYCDFGLRNEFFTRGTEK